MQRRINNGKQKKSAKGGNLRRLINKLFDPAMKVLYKCFVDLSAPLSLTLITTMAKSIELFQPIEMVFQSFGIQASGPKLKDRISFKFCFFVMCTVINLASSLAFFLFEAKSVADCGDSFYQTSTMSAMTFHIITYCWKSLEIHQLIEQFEKFFNKSKLKKIGFNLWFLRLNCFFLCKYLE